MADITGNPQVSVIIINWNRCEEIRSAIRILTRPGMEHVEIIVVDNASTDGSAEALGGDPAVRLIALAENVGPAAARNHAIDVARGRYLFFLDSDARVTGRGLRRLVERMDQDPSIGVIGCRIVDCKTREVDQWFYAEDRETHSRREFDTYSFTAAGALVRAEVFAKVGRFWGDLFIYNEETDLSIRILKAGYRILYSPTAEVYHATSEVGRVVPSGYWFYQARNKIWIYLRYYPFPLRWTKVCATSLIYLIRSASDRNLAACLSGIASGLGRRQIVREFAEKLTYEECRKIASLNRRFSPRLGRWPGRIAGPSAPVTSRYRTGGRSGRGGRR